MLQKGPCSDNEQGFLFLMTVTKIIYNNINTNSYTCSWHEISEIMKRLFSLYIIVLIMVLPQYVYAEDDSTIHIEDNLSATIREMLFQPRTTRQTSLDSIEIIVKKHPESPYYNLRMTMLGCVHMRFTPNANVDVIQKLFDEYRPYFEAVENKYFFFENWYFLVESYLFTGQETKAAELARELYLRAVKDNDTQGKAFSTYVLGMFYQMQNLSENAIEYYRLALPLFKEGKNWDLFDVCGINAIEVMKQEGLMDEIPPIFITLDSLADVTIANDMRKPLNLYNVLLTKGICSTYVYGEDKEKIKLYLDKTREIFDTHSDNIVDSIAIQTIERCYARLAGDIVAELKLTKDIYESMKGRQELANLGFETKNLADCYGKIGDYQKANQYLNEYFNLSDSLNMLIKRSSINHVAAEYNLDRLEELNGQLEEEVLYNKKAIMWLLFGVMMLILITLALALFHYRQRAKDLKRVSEMKSAFIRGITHEINTPLNAVLGFSEVIANMANTPEQVNMAALVKINSMRLVKVVNDTLFLSDYDTGTIVDIEPTMVNLASLTNRIRDNVEEVEQCHFIELAGDVFLNISVHEASLEAILFNLMHNAVHHGEPPVFVSYEKTNDNKIVFHVKDSGKKISPDIQKRIFERFYKADTFTDGLGVGLAVALIAAERIGATLEYNDKAEEGNEFVLTI